MVLTLILSQLFHKTSKIGNAAFEPVSNFPKGLGLSMPTKTPITKLDVNPINQASAFSFVVPVLPLNLSQFI